MFEDADLPDPDPGNVDVLIDVKASSVNPVDYKIRDGRASLLSLTFPAVLHPDCAGIVKSVGKNVADF